MRRVGGGFWAGWGDRTSDAHFLLVQPHPDMDCDDDDEITGHGVAIDEDSAPNLRKSVKIEMVPRHLVTPDTGPRAAVCPLTPRHQTPFLTCM